MNAQFQQIGEAFVAYYYQCCESNEMKPNLANLYHDDAFLSYETDQRQGKAAIMEKLAALPTDAHSVTKIDCQPFEDGSILILVLGQLKTDNPANPLGFSHNFVIKPGNNSYFITREIFHLCVHNF